MVQEEATAAAMRNHQLQVPHEVVAKQVVEREVLTKGLVAKGLVVTQRLVAKEVVVALAKELVAKQAAALAVAPRMRLVRVARLSAEDVLGLRTFHIALFLIGSTRFVGTLMEAPYFPIKYGSVS